MNVPNPYRVLQVDPEAEHDVIVAAYRRLARKYHPDVAVRPDSQARMVSINQAWEILRDPVRRAAVDRALARAAAAAARVAAADAHERTRASSPSSAGSDARSQGPADPDTGPSWPLKGMQDLHGGFGEESIRVSRDRPTGRSVTGGGYDARTMGTAQGHGAAGPPPGSPSGSVLHFGRYAGWSLGEVSRVDLEYLEWLDRMPIGRTYQAEIDALLRSGGRRAAAPPAGARRRGFFGRR